MQRVKKKTSKGEGTRKRERLQSGAKKDIQKDLKLTETRDLWDARLWKSTKEIGNHRLGRGQKKSKKLQEGSHWGRPLAP